jgi:GntR family transcriptional regulator, carbon starvation induced regulator
MAFSLDCFAFIFSIFGFRPVFRSISKIKHIAIIIATSRKEIEYCINAPQDFAAAAMLLNGMFMTLVAIKPRKEFGKTIAADVMHRLRSGIVACELKPGEPLKFDALRQAYGASFSTLREALTSLVADGLVVVEEQRGFHVAPVSLEDLLDLTHVRLLIEVEALRLSIENGKDDWEIWIITALHRLSRIEERAAGNPVIDPEWKGAHREFHLALISACQSPTLIALHKELFDRAERYRSLSAAVRPVPRNKEGEHRALMQAAIGRDTALAVTLIEKHIRSTTNNVAKYAKRLLKPD